MQAARKIWLSVLVAGLLMALGARFTAAAPSPVEGGADPTSDVDKWVIPDAEVVFHLNVRQIFNSPAMKKGGLEAIKDAISKDETAKTVFAATGIDPLKDIDSITASGMSGAGPKDVKALVVVRGRFNQDKIHDAAKEFAKKDSADVKLKLSKVDSTQLYEIEMKDNTLFGAFMDGTTLILTPSKEATLEALKTAGRRPVKVHKELQSVLAKLNPKESLSLGVVINEELKKALGKAPQAAELAPKLKTLTGNLNLSDGAALTLSVDTEGAAAAGKLLQVVKQLKALGELLAASNEEVGPAATEILGALKITQEKTAVSVSLKVTQEMIDKIKTKDKDK
jgi:hypothetical protein